VLNGLASHEHLEWPEQACLDLERRARVFVPASMMIVTAAGGGPVSDRPGPRTVAFGQGDGTAVSRNRRNGGT
jgi:hypothetical protein